MTSQVMPCRNFYFPSALQESYLGGYLGCRFELGSLQEGSTPFDFEDRFGVELTIYACIWNILRGDQQVPLGVLLISLIESVSKAPSLLFTGPVYIDIFQRCHLYLIATLASCLPFSSLGTQTYFGSSTGLFFFFFFQ